MKITDVETVWVGETNRSWLYVKVHTDKGITGLGESGLWGYPEASEGVIKAFKRYLIGVDPLKIEHHWQYLYRNTHFSGAAVMSALSAIDVALWDIAGKYFAVPTCVLLGGKYRDKVRVYIHIAGDTTEQLAQNALARVREGFNAVRFVPFGPDFLRMRHSDVMKLAVERVRAVREAVGDKIDIALEVGRKLTPIEAIILARDIEAFHPLFFEDPIPPGSSDAMAWVASQIRIPLATGERLHTIWEFKDLLDKKAVHIIRPDAGVAGGLTNCKKIAGLAEAYFATVAPHSPLGPVLSATHVQLSATLPNFLIQEYKKEDQPPRNEVVKEPVKLEGGYLIVPDKPGIGVELNDKALVKYPYKERPIVMPLGEDGAVTTDATYTSELRWEKRKEAL